MLASARDFVFGDNDAPVEDDIIAEVTLDVGHSNRGSASARVRGAVEAESATGGGIIRAVAVEAREKRTKRWLVYALKCKGDVLYIGVTNDLERRLQAHAEGTGSRFVSSRRPFVLVAVIPCEGKREAMSLEYRLKTLRRSRKLVELGLRLMTDGE